MKFESRFMIGNDSKNLLNSPLLSYFEEIEDYETCDKILKLCSKLENSN